MHCAALASSFCICVKAEQTSSASRVSLRRDVSRKLQQHPVSSRLVCRKLKDAPPEIKPEAAVQHLPESPHDLVAGPVEVHRPMPRGQQVIMTIVFQRDQLQRSLSQLLKVFGQYQRSGIARPDVSADEGGERVLFCRRASIKEHAATRLEQTLILFESGCIIGKVFGYTQVDDGIIGLF